MKQETRPANFASQTICTGDNLDIVRGMNSDSFDLIYLDPPFNSKANYAAPIGSKAAGAAFKDTWGLDDVKLVWHGEIKHEYPGLYALLTTTREIHGDSMMSYLIYMSIRIMEMRRLLKPDGSIYLHCDPTASHYRQGVQGLKRGRIYRIAPAPGLLAKAEKKLLTTFRAAYEADAPSAVETQRFHADSGGFLGISIGRTWAEIYWKRFRKVPVS